MMSEKKRQKLQTLVDKYKNKLIFLKKDILWYLIDQIQELLEFAFMVEGEKIPEIILGDDSNERVNEKSRQDDASKIFIKLTKRCYYNSQTEDGDRSTKLFKSSGVILASYPTLQCETVAKINGENIPTVQGMFWSDNEFLISLKTKTIAEQFRIINVLERTLNVLGKKFSKLGIQVFGIANIEVPEKKDKDNLETAKIYFHIRVQEKVIHNKEFIVKAIQIIAEDNDPYEDLFYFEDEETEKQRKLFMENNINDLKGKKITNQLPYDCSFSSED